MNTLSRSTVLKRTPFKRKPIGERAPVLMSTTPRRRKCAVCAEPFKPARMGQKVCSPACAQVQGRRETEKQERKETRERKQTLKTRSDWLKEAQVAFNAFIRERDKDKVCICCGRTSDKKYLTGSNWDCGHFRSTGSAPHLRFNEDNAHRQLTVCNRHGAGRAVDYRMGLIARIGLARVEALEADNMPRKWPIEELKEIRDRYRAKRRALKEKA